MTSNQIFLKIIWTVSIIHSLTLNWYILPIQRNGVHYIQYYTRKWPSLTAIFFPHKLPKSQKISNMHISDIQCIYNWSAKHQIPTLKTVVHCIICSITHKLKPTSRIYVQMIYKSSASYLENCRRRYPYRGRLPAVFNILNNGNLPLENPVKNRN